MKLTVFLRRFVPFMLAMLLTTALQASPLDEAKQAGYLGEQGDGYVGLVTPSAPSSAKQLMQEINLKRRDKYREIASKNNISLRSVEGVAGQKLIERADPGTYVLSPSGGWLRR
ncbi:Uncharacterized conserved protein UCP025560 [Magnetococcus marinus MC-1]|uniref:Uncharacterized conserved protein UCP025560 n=1 Tax=Magnetococcus marinus (strain ATCC BAA-1437 / JCM 17883 / MC-1) TaxID=156889 RepID=A0L441_MAGMM|nr:YdbL family protein [Magnetococcus marinus]ABK42734.1 Uncharacterized conserved protein UCP025560 [Magnetococcus marinus MC-1]